DAELMVLVWFHLTVPSSDRRRRRPFAIESFDRVAPLAELAAMTRTGGRPYVERLLAAVDRPTRSDAALLREAVYRRPDVESPVSEPAYEPSRAQVLGELTDHSALLETRWRETLGQVERDWTDDRKGPAAHRAALARLRACPNGERDASARE